MKTTQLSRLVAIVLILASFTACKNEPKSFTLTGTLTGITEGKAILRSLENKAKPDTAIIKEGKFVFTDTIAEPSQYYIMIEGKRSMVSFFAENANMTLTANVDTLGKAIITGGKTQDDAKILSDRKNELAEKYKISDLQKELYPRDTTLKVTKEREAEITGIIEKYTEEANQLSIDFIKEFPKSYYSAVLVSQVASGKNAVETENFIKMLNPKLATTSRVMKMLEQVEKMKKTEVGIDTFISDAHELTYAVDTTFAGKLHNGVVYLSVLTNDNVCALKSDGNVLIIDSKGAKVKEFKSNLKGKPSAIATDKSDNIYVLGSVMGEKTYESRGKTITIKTPVGVECVVFNAKGIKVREIKLDSVVTATGARVFGNNLLVADTRGRVVAIFDVQTGVKKYAIKNLRTCCGILDFSVRKDNEVLIANLGAFRVDGFDYEGNAIISFGQRGTSINDFHGCCNPVSIAFLSNGGIVTVEKDPTRIKVYSKEGAKKIEGIDELVKGCTYIPMIVDTKDNVYLASKTDGIVKCSPVK